MSHMPDVTIYTGRMCGYCSAAKRLLAKKGVAYTEIDVDTEFEGGRAGLVERFGQMTVPQIVIGETHVGGFDDLSALDRAGQLDPLLAPAA